MNKPLWCVVWLNGEHNALNNLPRRHTKMIRMPELKKTSKPFPALN